MQETVTGVLRDFGRLAVDVSTLDAGTDLYEVGLTSHASVNIMLALEDAFDVEFPDAMLRKDTFSSIGSITAAITELTSVPAV